MNIRITQKLVKAYKQAPNTCPVCGDTDCLDTHEPEFRGDTIYQDVWCASCGATWTDVYQLDWIDNLDDGKECEHLSVKAVGAKRYCNDCSKEWRVD